MGLGLSHHAALLAAHYRRYIQVDQKKLLALPLSSLLSAGRLSGCTSPYALQGSPLVHGDMLGLVALNHILRLVFGRMMDIAFEESIGGDFLDDDAPHKAGFRIPLNVVTALKDLRHGTF